MASIKTLGNMKLLKLILKKMLRILHLEIKRLDSREAIKTFWNTEHPICIYDDVGRENAIKELQMVRQLLRKDREREYPDANIEFGDFTYGNPEIRNWDKTANCKIGKYCSIAVGVAFFLGGEHHLEWMTTYPFSAFIGALHYGQGGGGLDPKYYVQRQTGEVNNIHIGNDVWIGSEAMIMSGVSIGDGCVIGTNSLVLKNTIIPDYTIWAGIPARPIRKRFSEDIIMQFRKIKWWDWSDEDICNVMPILESAAGDNIFKLVEYYENNIRNKIINKQ
jgi:acetyltransferase-like isoleucine patch superfamily enzyme